MSTLPIPVKRLLAHEARLAWRTLLPVGRGWSVLLGGLALVLLHALAYLAVRRFPSIVAAPSEQAAVVVLAVLAIAATLMTSAAMFALVDSLYEARDLVLYLMAPVPAWRIVVAKAAGTALRAALWPAVLLLPLADVAAACGARHWLSVYPLIIALALAATAVALSVALPLARLAGPRHARKALQLFAVVAGAAIYLAAELAQVGSGGADFPPSASASAPIATAITSAAGRDDGQARHAAAPRTIDRVIGFGARSFAGDVMSIALLVAGACGVFALAIGTMSRALLREAVREMDAGPRGRRRDAQPCVALDTRLRRAILVKGWKLVRRDPAFFAQAGTQVLYLLPLAIAQVTHRDTTSALVVPALVVLAGTLAANLVWLAVSAEDAPELVGSAPVGTACITRLKLIAAVIPVWCLVAPLIAWKAQDNAFEAGIAAVATLLSTLALAAIQRYRTRPTPRRGLKRRHKGDLVTALLEAVAMLGAGAAVYLASLEDLRRYALAPAAATIAAVGIARMLKRCP